MTVGNYRIELSQKLQEYGAGFDECFPELPSGFPSLPGDAIVLEKWVADNSLDAWYHHTRMVYDSEINEAFFAFQTEMAYFAIYITYFVDTVNDSVTLNDVSFYGSSEGIDSVLFAMDTIPSGVSEKSLEGIAKCVKGTPGFEWVLLLGAVCVVFLFRKKMG
jgi:hypothetical protein